MALQIETGIARLTDLGAISSALHVIFMFRGAERLVQSAASHEASGPVILRRGRRNASCTTSLGRDLPQLLQRTQIRRGYGGNEELSVQPGRDGSLSFMCMCFEEGFNVVARKSI